MSRPPENVCFRKVDIEGRPPDSRYGHSMSQVGPNVFVFSGQCGGTKTDELWALDMVGCRWKTVDTSGERPTARTGHISWEYGNKLYIHGGEIAHVRPPGQCSHEVKTPPTRTADTYKTGTLITEISRLPSKLNTRRMSLEMDRQGQTSKVVDDTYVLDLNTYSWKQLHYALPPLPRKHHSVQALSVHPKGLDGLPTITAESFTCAFIFGGKTDHRKEVTDEAYIFVLDDEVGSSLRTRWVSVPSKGEVPCARYGHAVEGVNSFLSSHRNDEGRPNAMLLFGGAKGATEFMNDLYSFDGMTCQWKQLHPVGKAPEPRMGHQMSAVTRRNGRQALIVFGGTVYDHTRNTYTYPKGIHVLDLYTMEWSELELTHNYPTPRSFFTMVTISDKAANEAIEAEYMLAQKRISDSENAGNAVNSISAHVSAILGLNEADLKTQKANQSVQKVHEVFCGNISKSTVLIFGGINNVHCDNTTWVANFSYGRPSVKDVTSKDNSKSPTDCQTFMSFQKQKLELIQRIDMWQDRAVAAETENKKLIKTLRQQEKTIADLQRVSDTKYAKKEKEYKETIAKLTKQLEQTRAELLKTVHIASLNDSMTHIYTDYLKEEQTQNSLKSGQFEGEKLGAFSNK